MKLRLCALRRCLFWQKYAHHTVLWDLQVSRQRGAMFDYGIKPWGTYLQADTKFQKCTYVNFSLESSRWGLCILKVFERFLLDGLKSNDY